MNQYLPYDPGVLPSSPAPSAGEQIALKIEGFPPYKDLHFSLRNSRHKNYPRFVILRQAAIKAMAGRAPYRGGVRLDFVMHAPDFETNRGQADYLGGILDSLDGSHGKEFTYLPIVYEDDCQVACSSAFSEDTEIWYELRIVFLGKDWRTESGNKHTHSSAKP
jgi:hypothetical protein